MLEQTYNGEQVWNTMQEPRCPVYMSTGTMLLLSALNKGWQIEKVELTPSWDQNGFIYLVSLRRNFQEFGQQIILPKNHLVEDLLNYAAAGCFNPHVYNFLGVNA